MCNAIVTRASNHNDETPFILCSCQVTRRNSFTKNTTTELYLFVHVGFSYSVEIIHAAEMGTIWKYKCSVAMKSEWLEGLCSPSFGSNRSKYFDYLLPSHHTVSLADTFQTSINKRNTELHPYATDIDTKNIYLSYAFTEARRKKKNKP